MGGIAERYFPFFLKNNYYFERNLMKCLEL